MRKEEFEKLELTEKRNEYNKQLITLIALMEEFTGTVMSDYHNYDPTLDDQKSESEILDMNYANVLALKEHIVDLLKKVVKDEETKEETN